MESKIFSVGLMIACVVSTCLCQQQQQAPSFLQSGSSVVQPQTKLEDIERDSLASAFSHKTAAATTSVQQQQQQSGKSLSSASSPQQQAYLQQTNAVVAPQQQQYFVQPSPYQAVQQPPLFVYPSQQPQYLTQPFQMAFDYAGVQYMIINPNAYNPAANNQIYQQYYMPTSAAAAAAPQPSAVPQYVSKPSAPSAAAVAAVPTTPAPQVEYKQQQFAVPVPVVQAPQQVYKYVLPNAAPAAYQYVQQPTGGTVDFSYVTRHSVPSAQFKAPAAPAQSQYVQQQQQQPQQQQYQQQQQQPQQQQHQQQQPQQQQYQQQPQQQQQYQSQQSQQFYYTIPATAGQLHSTEPQQPRVQQSIKSQFSSGIKSTTASPYKEPFAYKFESSPVQQQSQPQQQQQQQPQQSGTAYSTLRFSV